MNLTIQDFADLFTHGDTATVHCAMSGTKVRTLTKQGDNCHLIAGDGTELNIPLNTPVVYEPWVMDRGSLNFTLDNQPLKLCTELDVLKSSGEEYTLVPNRLEVEIALLAHTESDLTISVMRQVARRMGLTNPELINDLYESVISYTENHPEDHGWGSSDTAAVYRAFEQWYLTGLQVGEKVVEAERSSCMEGKKGVIYISENEMGTAVTHGTRRIKDIK